MNKRKRTGLCSCGHQGEEHTIMSGPNSIGRMTFNLCGHDKWTDGYNVITKCPCQGFRQAGIAQRLRTWLRPEPPVSGHVPTDSSNG